MFKCFWLIKLVVLILWLLEMLPLDPCCPWIFLLNCLLWCPSHREGKSSRISEHLDLAYNDQATGYRLFSKSFWLLCVPLSVQAWQSKVMTCGPRAAWRAVDEQPLDMRSPFLLTVVSNGLGCDGKLSSVTLRSGLKKREKFKYVYR